MGRTLLDTNGVRLSLSDTDGGIKVSHAILRKNFLRRVYVIDIETYAKYPAVDGYSTSYEDDRTSEIYLGSSDYTLHYQEDENDPETDTGLTALSVVEVTLPQHLRLPDWLTRRSRWNRPSWHLMASATDKYTVQIVAWYGRY